MIGKNTDSHLKMRTVIVKKIQELPQVLRWCKKRFCEETGIHILGEVFWGFLIGVINWEVR